VFILKVPEEQGSTVLFIDFDVAIISAVGKGGELLGKVPGMHFYV